jgi:hypothetical protein
MRRFLQFALALDLLLVAGNIATGFALGPGGVLMDEPVFRFVEGSSA